MARMGRVALTGVLAAALLALPGTAAADRNDVVRVEPGDNAATSVAFSQATGDAAETVLIGRDDLFADSLASGSLQADGSPLLLTDSAELDALVAAEISRLGATDAIVLGGTAAISDDVVEELEDLGLDVSRRQGATRTETAIDIAEDNISTTALLVRGFTAGTDETQAFADSIAAGGWAADTGWPVLFTQTEVLTGSTRDFLDASSITDVVIIGGEAAVDADVAAAVTALGIDVRRVAGGNRFETATAIAAERGFDDETDVERVILVEGQATDAWAAGFAAAAHAAIFDAPIVLANGNAVPPETLAFLDPTAFAVDEDDVDGPVLVCATTEEACTAAIAALGLPTDAAVAITSGTIDPGDTVTGTIDLDGQTATVRVSGCGLAPNSTLSLDAGGAFSLPLPASQTTSCTLTFVVTFPNGTAQTETRDVSITPPASGPTQSGVIIATAASGYTFVTATGQSIAVTYDADDSFQIRGTTASQAAWTVQREVGALISFTDDATAADLDVHNITDPDPYDSGVIANVDVAGTEFDFIEPNTLTVLRANVSYAGSTYRIGNATAMVAAFSADLNEGDLVTIQDDGGANERFDLTNQTVTGTVDVDTVTLGVSVTMTINGLGDDPADDANDGTFVAEPGDTYTGPAATYAAFEAQVNDGDTVAYSRAGGVETYRLTNSAPPTVTGTVTDGSVPNTVEYLPAGSATPATFTYTGAADFRLNGAIVLEGEVEAALTPGDTISYTPDDPDTGANEERVALTDANLSGRVADIDVGAHTFDVLSAAGGIIANDFDYLTSLYAGADVRYFTGMTERTLGEFETDLGMAPASSTVTVAPIPGNLGTRITLTL